MEGRDSARGGGHTDRDALACFLSNRYRCPSPIACSAAALSLAAASRAAATSLAADSLTCATSLAAAALTSASASRAATVSPTAAAFSPAASSSAAAADPKTYRYRSANVPPSNTISERHTPPHISKPHTPSHRYRNRTPEGPKTLTSTIPRDAHRSHTDTFRTRPRRGDTRRHGDRCAMSAGGRDPVAGAPTSGYRRVYERAARWQRPWRENLQGVVERTADGGGSNFQSGIRQPQHRESPLSIRDRG